MQLVRDLLAKGKASGFNVMRTWAHAVNPQYAVQVCGCWAGAAAGVGGWVGGGGGEPSAFLLRDRCAAAGASPWSCSPSLCCACPGCAHASHHAVELFPHWQTAPGKYNEAALRGLDYLIDEARKAGIRVSLLGPSYCQDWEAQDLVKSSAHQQATAVGAGPCPPA